MKLGLPSWIAPGIAAAALMALSAALAGSHAHAVAGPGRKTAPVKASTAPAAAANGAAVSGEALFQENCGSCHDLTLTTDQRKSRGDWQATVSRMVTSGAALSDTQAAQVVDYLTRNYGAS